MKHPKTQSTAKCLAVVRKCLQQRLDRTDFELVLKTLDAESSLSPLSLTQVLLDCRQNFCAPGDPLISLYIQTLLLSTRIQLSDLCFVFASKWNHEIRQNATRDKKVLLESDLETLGETSSLIMTSKLVLGEVAVTRCLEIVSRWLHAMTKWEIQHAGHLEETSTASTIEPVGKLLAALCSTGSAMTVLAQHHNSAQSAIESGQIKVELRNTVMQALSSCLSFPGLSIPLFETLTHVQKHYDLYDVQDEGTGVPTEAQATEVRSLRFQMDLPEAPVVPSRVAMTAFLKTLLAAGKTVDDNQIYNLLHTRHAGDSAAMFNELVYSSFDALTSRVSESQTQLFQLQCRIFIVNKLPVVLVSITGSSFAPLSSEQLLIDIWPQISAILFARNFTTIGRSFLHVCSLAHLITAETVNTLAGSEQIQLPKGLYSKDDLVAQVEANHSRCHKLIDELLRNDGNAGTISHAVVEIMHKYVQAKDTQSLKDLANTLTRKPDTINTIAMFLRPAYVISPLCVLLDHWRWDDIHGESQPVYDEFGSVLLLIVAFKTRLGLTTSETGALDQQGFTFHYLTGCSAEQEVSDMSETTNKHLGDWINAFYIAEALSDDLTSGCSAQEFHLLVPTLLRQSVLAFAKGRLSSEALKTGLEYLLEPFLLPSLVAAFAWISQTAQRTSDAMSLMLPVLLNSPGNTEAAEIHRTIACMSAKSLKQRIACIPDIDNTATLQLLQQYDAFTLCLDAEAAEISAWATSPGGLIGSLQRALAAQLEQSTAGTVNTDTLDAATILHTVRQVKGPNITIQVLLDFLLQYARNQNYFPLVLDSAATLICAEDLITGSLLREALRQKCNRIGDLLKAAKNVEAEVLVHLHRRADVVGNTLTQPSIAINQPAFVPLHNMDIANADLDGAPAQPDMDILENEQPEAQDMDQVLDATATAMGLEQTNTNTNSLDDMFGMQSDNMGFDNLEDFDIDDMF